MDENDWPPKGRNREVQFRNKNEFFKAREEGGDFLVHFGVDSISSRENVTNRTLVRNSSDFLG